MPDPGRDLHGAPGTPYPAGQRHAGVTAAPDDHRHQIGQFPARELDLYGNQLARCLQALGTNAPIRADIQHELATVRAEQASRASASEPGRLPAVTGLTAGELDRTRRELAASRAWPGPARPCAGRSWPTWPPSRPSCPAGPPASPDSHQPPECMNPSGQRAHGLR